MSATAVGCSNLLAALLLAACGGGGGGGSNQSGTPHSIGGAVSGLPAGTTVVLQNNRGDNLAFSANGTFTFASELYNGASYAVTVLTQPTGANCTVTNASGAVLNSNVTNVSVSCFATGPVVTVQAAAVDPDGDALSYQWVATDGRVQNVNGPTTTWTLPAGPGLHFLYVQVADGKGGYVERRVVVSTDDIGTPAVIAAPTTIAAPPAPAGAGITVRHTEAYLVLNYAPTGQDGSGGYSIRVATPDLQVRRVDDKTGTTLGTTTTNLKGEFTFSNSAPGSYTYTCTGAGAGGTVSADCGGDLITPLPYSQYNEEYVADIWNGSPVLLTPTGVIGRVLQADGSQCGTRNNYFGTEATASVKLLDASGNLLSGPQRVNAYGEYFLPFIPTRTQSVVVRASCEGAASVDGSVIVGTDPAAGQFIKDIALPNHAPVVNSITATLGSQTVGSMAPPPTGLPSDINPRPDSFLSYKGVDTRQSACQYYKAIGAVQDCDSNGNPSGAQLTFDDWKRAHKMAPYNTQPEMSATYINRMDLNLARDMHGIVNGPNDVAYYVCNHAGPPFGAGETQANIDIAVANAKSGNRNLIACVVMDYSISNGVNNNQPFTKFYIFGPANNLLLSINLDGRREKFMPGVCAVCHGGERYRGAFPADGSGAANILGHFLPFDLGNYNFSSAAGLIETAQQASFHQLNLGILATDVTRQTRTLIAGWYAAGTDVLDKTYLPPSWQSQDAIAKNFYHTVYARSCRTCHTALDPAAYDYDNLSTFQTGFRPSTVVGGNGSLYRSYSMPNSLVTFDRFWLSAGSAADQPAALAAYSHLPSPLALVPDPRWPVNPQAPAIATQPQSLTLVQGQSATLSVVATSSLPVTYRWTNHGTPIAGATSATLMTAPLLLADSGAVMNATVTSLAGVTTSQSATLVVTPALGGPGVMTQPQQTVVAAGQAATFNAVAVGSGLTYQWRRNGTPISGATGSSYTLAQPMPADNGAQFSVVISNTLGSVTSLAGTLIVTSSAGAPGILTAPQGATVYAGQSADFTVATTGAAPLSYQWLRNGAPIAGATGATYSLASTTALDNGTQFSVTVSNSLGSATSSPAALTVKPTPVISLLAGHIDSGLGAVDGTGTAARFYFPKGMASDSAGNVYVADGSNSTIRKISPAGAVTTLAGTAGQCGSTDGVGAAALFCGPAGVAADSAGNVYVADTFNNTIRKITAAGVVSTLAGAVDQIDSIDGTGSAARFNLPTAVAADSTGNVYVTDSGNFTIRKITPSGVVTTFAGAAGVSGSIDGIGAAARFGSGSTGVATDNLGNVYVADTANSTIRKITPNGTVTTLAGSAGNCGSNDGAGTLATFCDPSGVATDSAGNVYVSDDSTTIRKITPGAVVTTLAGSALQFGSTDGVGAAARFSNPNGLAVGSAGRIYVADTNNNTIRAITAAGAVTTLAGATRTPGAVDGTGAAAYFNSPGGVATDPGGNVYVADDANHTIRKITPLGVTTTFAGVAGVPGSIDGSGAAARFYYPSAIAADSAGNLYVVDSGNDTVRKITPAGNVTTLAGTAGQPGSADGTGLAAQFWFSDFGTGTGVATDSAGNVYVADSNNYTIRKITPTGVVTTLAGTAGQYGSTDGIGAAASFWYPTGVATDSVGNVYVADGALRKITPAGDVGTLAAITWAQAVVTDKTGNLYIAGAYTYSIGKVTPAGVLTTFAGGAQPGVAPGGYTGPLPGALVPNGGMAIDLNNVLYLTEIDGVIKIVLP